MTSVFTKEIWFILIWLLVCGPTNQSQYMIQKIDGNFFQ